MKRILKWTAILLITTAVVIVAILYLQGTRKTESNGEYVALGSSFAAGIGLGARAPGSPALCMRSHAGYPVLLAEELGLRLVDMSCSGATSEHVLNGGQFFQGPQLTAVGPDTRLVTVTIGGNDVSYVGDMFLAAGAGGPLVSLSGKLFTSGPEPLEKRPFVQVRKNLVAIVGFVRRSAPHAKIVIATYPTILPAQGTCKPLRIDAKQAELSRQVGERLAVVSRKAADESGAIFVDMNEMGREHNACSTMPWVLPATIESGTPFHPSHAGARATSEAIAAALRSPA